MGAHDSEHREASRGRLPGRLPFHPAPATPLNPGAVALGLLVFLFGLGVFSGLVRRGFELDPQRVADLSPRSRLLVRSYVEQEDALDALFVGSSRFLRGIDPTRFAQIAAREGREVRAFNFSMNGMRMPEIIERVDWVLAREPRKLKWIFVELTSLDPHYREKNRLGRRMAGWHSARATRDALRVILGSDRPGPEKRADALPHLAEFLLRRSNLGLGHEEVLRYGRGYRDDLDIPGFDGYLTAAEESEYLPQTRRRHRASDPGASAEDSPEERDDLPPAQEAVLREFIDRVARHGVELLFVRPPGPHADLPVRTRQAGEEHTFRHADERGLLANRLSYLSPSKYPGLYRGVLYRDAGHLNENGARLFSRRLALDFVEFLDGAEAGSGE